MLPFVTDPSWPDANVSQDILITKLQDYINFKKNHIKTLKLTAAAKKVHLDNCVLPFRTHAGLCSGLVAYWLYLKRIGEEGKFIHALTHIVTWSSKAMHKDVYEDQIIEGFLNAIAALHFDSELRYNEVDYQEDLEKTINDALGSNFDRVREEFNFSFIFNKASLAKFFEKFIVENKMIYLNNIQHAIGLMYANGTYHLYNPSAPGGALRFDNINTLVEGIFAEFAEHNIYSNELVLFASTLGLVEEPPLHFNKLQLMHEILQLTPENELMHKNELLSLLVKHNEIDMLTQLLHKGLRVDYNDIKTETLAGLALANNNTALLYLLLANGADMYSKHRGLSLWDLGLLNKNPEGIAILLAFGYEIPEKDKNNSIAKALQQNLANVYQKIISTAIILQQEILHVPQILNLDMLNGHDVIAFLRHAKLKMDLDKSIEDMQINWKGRSYQGNAGILALAKCYNESDNHNDIFTLGQKTQIYDLLKYFNTNNFDFNKRLLSLINAITKEITSKKIDQYTLDDLIEIDVILDELEVMGTTPTRLDPRKIALVHKISKVKSLIEKYLRENGIASIKDHLAKINKDTSQRNYLFFTPSKFDAIPEISYGTVANILRSHLS